MVDYNTELEKILERRINTIKDLKDAIKEYKNTLATANEGSEEWVKATKNLEVAQERVNKINKAAKGQLDAYNNSEKDSINVLKEKIKQLNLERNAMDMNSKEYAEATKELKVLNDKLREAGTSAGDWRANVGNYTQSITDAFGQLGSAAGGLTGPLGAVNASMLKLAANPVGAVVLAIVAALKLFAEGIKSSEDNTNKFNQILAPLKGLLDVIKTALEEATAKVLDWIQKLQQNEGIMKGFQLVFQALATAFNLLKKNIENQIEVLGRWFGKIKTVASKIWDVFQPAIETIQNVFNVVKGKLEPVLKWIIDKWNWLAKTDVGKLFGLKTVKDVAEAWETAGEQTETFTNKVKEAGKEEERVAKQTEALQKKRRALLQADAKLRGEVAQLELEIAEERNAEEKDYDKILNLIDEKTKKSIELAKNNIALKQAELDIIRKRIALSPSDTAAKDEEAAAAAALTDAQNALKQAQTAGEREKTKILKAKTSEEQTKKNEDFRESVTKLTAALKELDWQYQDTLETLNKPLKAPEGAEMDKESVNEYYDAVVEGIKAEYEAYVAMTDGKIAELEKFIEAQKALNNDVSSQEAQLAQLRRDREKAYNKMRDKTQQAEEKRAKDQKTVFNATLNAYGGMLDGMQNLFEENTIAYKVTATAKAIIDTFTAANAVLAEQAGGVVARVAAMAGVIAAGVANVVSIWKVNPKSENSTPSAGASAVAEPPQIIDSTPYTYTRSLQTEEEQEEILNRPIWVSVEEISNKQNMVQVRDQEATF